MEAAEPTVVDRPSENRFVLDEGDLQAQLVYRVHGDRLILIHTEVPDALGGHGLGGRLVRGAVDRAAREGLTVVPWCPYARKWLRDHPDATEAVKIDWDSRPPQ